MQVCQGPQGWPVAGSGGRNEGMEWVGQGWELTLTRSGSTGPGIPMPLTRGSHIWVCPLMAVVLYPYHNFWFECIGAKIMLNFSIN